MKMWLCLIVLVCCPYGLVAEEAVDEAVVQDADASSVDRAGKQLSAACKTSTIVRQSEEEGASTDESNGSVVTVDQAPTSPALVLLQMLANPVAALTTLTAPVGTSEQLASASAVDGSVAAPPFSMTDFFTGVLTVLNTMNPFFWMNELVNSISTATTTEAIPTTDNRVDYAPLMGPLLLGAAVTVPAAIAAVTGTDLASTAEEVTSFVLDSLDAVVAASRREEQYSTSTGDFPYDSQLYLSEPFIPTNSLNEGTIPHRVKRAAPSLADLVTSSIRTYHHLFDSDRK